MKKTKNSQTQTKFTGSYKKKECNMSDLVFSSTEGMWPQRLWKLDI